MEIPTDFQIRLRLTFTILLLNKNAIRFTSNLFNYNLYTILSEVSLNLPGDAGTRGTANRRAKPPRGKATIGASPSGTRPATGALTAVAGGTGGGLRRLAPRPPFPTRARGTDTFPASTAMRGKGSGSE